MFEEKSKDKMSEEELEPAISGQLVEVALKYWADDARKPAVVSKIPEGLKVPNNCSIVSLKYLI